MLRTNNRAFNMISRNKSNSEKKMFHAYHRGLEKVRRQVQASGTTNVPSESKIAFVINKEVQPAYKFVARAGFTYSIVQVEQAVGQPITRFIAKASNQDLLDLGLLAVQREVVNGGMKKVKTVAETYRKRLQNQMKLSIAANESKNKLAARIQNMTGVTQRQARTIARTETTKVFNAGSLAGYKKSTITEGKEWVTNIMGNPRHPPESQFNHLGANSEQVPLDKPFVRTGESLQYPGDPSGSAGNVINCYCGQTPVINLKKPGSKIPQGVNVPEEVGTVDYLVPPVTDNKSKISVFGMDNVALKQGKSLTKVESITLENHYLNSLGSFHINDNLRHAGAGWDAANKKYLNNLANNISKAINKSVTTSDVISYRGIGTGVNKIGIGDIIKDKGFVSTSFDINHATSFIVESGSPNIIGGRLMEIRIPKGTSALYESSVHNNKYYKGSSAFRKEKELVLQRGMKFKKIGETTKTIASKKYNVEIMEVVSE